jgi:preprotein translocase subunit SecG
MQKVLLVVQVISGVLLMITILLQQKGEGLSGVFGGDTGGSYQTKRGIEKSLYYATIALSVVFFGAAVLKLLY